MGKLIGIARRAKSRDPMEMLDQADISIANGLEGDCKGKRFPLRQFTIMTLEDWQNSLDLIGKPNLDWTIRRANLLVTDIKLPRGKGSRLLIGEVEVEVTDQTSPCQQMENAFVGLRKALAGDWRGGVTCRIIEGGKIKVGNQVRTLLELPETIIRLP